MQGRAAAQPQRLQDFVHAGDGQLHAPLRPAGIVEAEIARCGYLLLALGQRERRDLDAPARIAPALQFGRQADADERFRLRDRRHRVSIEGVAVAENQSSGGRIARSMRDPMS